MKHLVNNPEAQKAGVKFVVVPFNVADKGSTINGVNYPFSKEMIGLSLFRVANRTNHDLKGPEAGIVVAKFVDFYHNMKPQDLSKEQNEFFGNEASELPVIPNHLPMLTDMPKETVVVIDFIMQSHGNEGAKTLIREAVAQISKSRSMKRWVGNINANLTMQSREWEGIIEAAMAKKSSQLDTTIIQAKQPTYCAIFFSPSTVHDLIRHAEAKMGWGVELKGSTKAHVTLAHKKDGGCLSSLINGNVVGQETKVGVLAYYNTKEFKAFKVKVSDDDSKVKPVNGDYAHITIATAKGVESGQVAELMRCMDSGIGGADSFKFIFAEPYTISGKIEFK